MLMNHGSCSSIASFILIFRCAFWQRSTTLMLISLVGYAWTFSRTSGHLHFRFAQCSSGEQRWGIRLQIEIIERGANKDLPWLILNKKNVDQLKINLLCICMFISHLYVSIITLQYSSAYECSKPWRSLGRRYCETLEDQRNRRNEHSKTMDTSVCAALKWYSAGKCSNIICRISIV